VVDHAGAARKAYEDSLTALRRTVVTPSGEEISEAGTGRLSLGPEALRPHRGSRPGQPDFDVLIIGSGYGGAVCAARLAAHRRPGVKIGVLERGREWVPGTFPSSLANFQPFSPRRSAAVPCRSGRRATPPPTHLAAAAWDARRPTVS